MSDLTFERSLYVANEFGGIFIGLQTYMFFHSWYLLRQGSGMPPRKRIFYNTYGFIMLFLSAFAWMGNALMGQLMWIDHRDFPGGPLAYYFDKSTIWFSVLGSAASIVQNIMNDSLLLYRCYIIWNGNRWIVAFPILVFIGSTVMAVISLVQSALPNANFFQQATTNFAVPWLSLTSGLNVIVTALIAGRILFVGHKYGSSLSQTGVSEVYTGVIAILVESALPMSVLGVLFAIFLGKNLPSAISFAEIWGAFVALAPQLIILRVAMGRAWTKNTLNQLTSAPIEFARSGSSTILNNSTVLKGMELRNISKVGESAKHTLTGSV